MLLAHYAFNQTAGPSITDVSGNARHGTVAGSVSFVAGQIGNAVSLPGTSANHVDLPDGLLGSVNDLTIAVWVRPRTDRVWSRIFDFGNSTNVNMFLTPHASVGAVNALRFAITMNGTGGEQRLDGAVLATGTWTHVAVVLGSNGGTLYVNGAAVMTNSSLLMRPSMLGATTNNWVGRSQYTADPYFDGEIDELRIYGRALTAAEVTGLYQLR